MNNTSSMRLLYHNFKGGHPYQNNPQITTEIFTWMKGIKKVSVDNFSRK